jgi:phage terminase large subunit-like protein
MSGGVAVGERVPVCGYTFDSVECAGKGEHFCAPRADKAQGFFEEVLMHTKGRYARKKFILADWQRDDIIRPLFGKVVWSEEYQSYKRRYEVAWLEVARKAISVDTPVLTANRGWTTVGGVEAGDQVFNLEGQPETVEFVSDVYTEMAYRVTSRFGKSLEVGIDHDWLVQDRRKPRGTLRQPDGTRLKGDYAKYVATTGDLLNAPLKDKRGVYLNALPSIGSLKIDSGRLPVDPYCLGAWIGDGTSKSGAITAHEDDQPFMRAQFEEAGYETRSTNAPQVFYVQKLMTQLRALGVLHNKHVPEQYLLASEADRLDLLRGLMDTDGWASEKGKSLIYGFCAKNVGVADAVEFLARSVGYNTRRGIKHVKGYGEYHEVYFAATEGLPNPHRMPRKALKVRKSASRNQLDSIVSIEATGVKRTKCIGIQSGFFLAGKDLMPTGQCGKTELLAGIMLYLLVADGEHSAEIYGVARDIKQAKLAFDVAAQMVIFSPVLSKRLKVSDYKKRIFDLKTNSFYEVIAADAKSALGSNPSGVGADEILAWQDGEMWSSLRTGMGSGARLQPLMVASTTAGNDTEGFAGQMHKNMERVAENPDTPENHHIFVYIRNTPKDADPWDEANWWHANPALGDFLSLESLRKQALEARANPIAEMAFRQYRLNQWQSTTVRWMNMFAWDKKANKSTVYETNEKLLNSFAGCECWFGLDLAAKQDLCSICYLFPSDDPADGVDVVWRHFICQAGLERLDRLNNGRFSTEFVRNGWLEVTPGDVLDFEVLYAAIKQDSLRFVMLGGDVDRAMSEPVIQRIRLDTGIGVDDIYAYDFTYGNVSDGMHRVFDMVTDGTFRHHANPLARFCVDATEARYKAADPDQIIPDKPNRLRASKRIDATAAAILAVNAWWTREGDVNSYYNDHEVRILG